MNYHENAADPCPVGGAKTINHHEMLMTANINECKGKMEIAELVGSLRFIVQNLDDAAHEAAVAADAIEAKNVGAGHYHIGRFAAHARAACGAFKDIVGTEVV